ncbi:MAG: helicase C-terminal domain-containing protein [Candidatus Margulisiibacteriota bacterium]|jgi:ATP-dependent DNA helicase DinG
MKTYICLDLETTGLAYKTNEIIEIGLVKIVNSEIVDRFSSLVKPQGRLLGFITKLTGITSAMLQDAPLFEEIVPSILSFIGEATIVAHNATFDLDMLNQELFRINYGKLINKALDTKDLSLVLHPELLSHKLSALVNYYDLKFTHHRALTDAEAVANIFIRFRKEILSINPIIIAEAIKLLPSSKNDLKDYFSEIYFEIDKSKSFYYLDYLDSYKKPKKYKKQDNTIDDINKFFQNDSPLKVNFSEFEIRESQIKMAGFIEACFKENNLGMIEAGTGIGKTIAYLLPAIIWARKNGTPVIISTKTKHLQNQIMYQDILKVKSDKTPSFTYALVKGKENYIDIAKFDTIYKNYTLGLLKKDVVEFLGLLSWLLKTATGDLSELHSSIYNIFYYKVHFTSFSDSFYQKDIYKNKCFVNKMRHRAKDVDIVITNHALVFSDLLHNAKILPDYQYLIFDEAHSIEDVASNTASINFNNFTLKEIFNQFKTTHQESLINQIIKMQSLLLNTISNDLICEIKDKNAQLVQLNEIFFESVKVFLINNNRESYDKQQFVLDDKARNLLDWQNVNQNHHELITELLKFQYLLEQLTQKKEVPDSGSDITKNFIKRLNDTIQYLGEMISNIQLIFSFNQENINWLEMQSIHNDKLIKLISAPIDLRSTFKLLLDDKKSCIFTSATLTINKNFDYLINRLGIADEKGRIKKLYLESEFNYKEQALFNTITDLPVYNENQEYFKSLAEIIFKIVVSLETKTLVLFTSQKSLKLTYSYLQRYLKEYPITVFCQNLHGSRESIIERFKQTETGVIFGLDSFWEGIDLAGDLLQCVILQKMPFPVPSEPLTKARINLIEAEGKNGFRDYMLPMAVLKFKQGIGRLIRTKNDTGQLFILDERVFNKSYGKNFLNEISKFKQKKGVLADILN